MAATVRAAVSAAAALALFAPAASAATLRPMTTLHAPVVLLSDLFDDAGPLAGRVLGPAPAPGERIVVPARQLAAIARMFGVAWQPATPADSAVLERPGRPLPRQALLDALRPALAGVGAPEDAELAIHGLTVPMIPAETTASVSVEQLDDDGAGGGFAAALLVTGEGMAPLRLRLAGHAVAMLHLPVPAHALSAGSVLRADDLTAARLRAGAVRGQVAMTAAELVGMRLRRAAQPGQPVALGDLQRPGTVEKGAPVLLQIEIGGLTATTQGIALGTGAPGERIPVLNPVTHLVVQGDVLPTGAVAVAPGSLPAPENAHTLADMATR